MKKGKTLTEQWMEEHPNDEPCPQPHNGLAAHAWRLKRGIGASAAWAREKQARRAAESKT
jgi:hypothetical protein